MLTNDMREHQISLRFNAEEWERAERVAKAHGLNVQNMIRVLLKREDDAIGAAADTKKPAKKGGAR